MRQSIRLGTFYGIPVGVNWSVLVIVALFAWELAEYVLPAQSGHPDVGDWIAGVAGALVLVLSLLAHELSHAVVARRNGVRVRSITLFVFGGVAQLEGEAHTPGADFRIAAVGPMTSLLLAAIFGAAHASAVALGEQGRTINLLTWLWEINLLLAGFNLIPAAPLDGGRILRSALWKRSGDRFRASLTAARAGRGFGALLIVLGLLSFLYVGLSGLWAALIGLFLYSAARGEEQYALMHGSLERLEVRQVMRPNPPVLSERTTVAEVVEASFWHLREEALAITDEQGRLTGVVTTRAMVNVPNDRRQVTSLAEIAIPISKTAMARPDEALSALLERMETQDERVALVLEDSGRLVGMVTGTDLQRAAELNRAPEALRSGRR